MPLINALEKRRFSDKGPRPQALAVGKNMAVMLLCLQCGQVLQPPESDASEVLFLVLEGEGTIREGEIEHAVKTGDLVHIPPGERKALIAGEGTFTVLGVRHLKGRK
jgi:quercetin dioxygenase-like cupin family protein